MQIEKFSKKQGEILKFAYSDEGVLICDGAVRSGKTIVMSFAFVLWAMQNFDRTNFAICGKTVSNAERNILRPFQQIEGMPFKTQYKISTRMLTVRCAERENYFYLFGGKDESSQALIQGLTLAGVLFDEVALMPKSFVDQAIARTLSFKNAKLWFNCNPESPNHWFYKEWIKDDKKPKKHLHFLMRDNPILGDAEIARAESFFAGVFYQRFILGEWVLSEGLVYDFGEPNIVDEIPSNGEYYISIDYGTMNPFSAGLWCVLGDKATRIKEYYYNGREKAVQRTDEDYCDSVEELAKGYNIRQIVVDPSAASFITALRRRGFTIRKANNDVLDGIRRTAVYLKNGNIKIHRSCVDAIAEFGLYRWDDKATQDTVVKENDHCLTGDTVVNTILGGRKIKDLVGKFGFVWSYNEKRKKKCIRPFFGVKKTRENQPILKITLENGKVVRCTPEHRILTENGWIEAKYLTQSSRIIDINAVHLVGVAKIEIEPNEDVYNMEVIGTHNFAVNGGVIVHNCMDDIRYFCNTIMKNKVRKERIYSGVYVMNYRNTRFCENLNIAQFETEGQYNIPVLKPYVYEPCEFVGFNYAKSAKDKRKKGLHFFVDDYQFERLWREPLAYINLICEFHSIMTPDFSLYTDYPKALQIYNHYRKHWLGALWQSMGYKVIPTIAWSDRDSFDWCFDGTPKGATVAVSSVGTQRSKETKQLFLDGWNEMLARLEPETVIFHGDVPKECNANIVRIKSFQEKFMEAKLNGW